MATLLVVLNDALTYSPVLVTGHNLRNGAVQLECVPFPLPQTAPPTAQRNVTEELADLLGTAGAATAADQADETAYHAKLALWRDLHAHPAMQRLGAKVDLAHSLGYITMMKVNAATGELAQYNNDWLVTNVHFGMPLFDKHINRACREVIVQNNMFSGAVPGTCRRRLIALQTRACGCRSWRADGWRCTCWTSLTRRWCMRAWAVPASRPQNHRLSFAPGATQKSPYPTQSLQFSNGTLSVYDPSVESRDVFYGPW